MIRDLTRRGRKLFKLLANPIYRRGLRSGTAAAVEHEVAIRPLRVNTVIDIGANTGQFSLVVRALFPSVTIHAFEPLLSSACSYISLFATQENTFLHAVAAGAVECVSEINVSRRRDSSSLLPISDMQSNIFPGTQQQCVERIQVVRVDDVLASKELVKPILVKLDVQGFEKVALSGMPLILDQATFVYAEISFIELYSGQVLASELISWLSTRGFYLKGVFNLTVTTAGEPVQADALFVRAAA